MRTWLLLPTIIVQGHSGASLPVLGSLMAVRSTSRLLPIVSLFLVASIAMLMTYSRATSGIFQIVYRPMKTMCRGYKEVCQRVRLVSPRALCSRKSCSPSAGSHKKCLRTYSVAGDMTRPSTE